MKNTTIRLGLAALVTVSIVGCGSSGDGGSDYTPHPYDAPPISEADKGAYLSAVNAARSVGRSCGSLGFFPPAPALVWSDSLYKAAYEHSQDMDATGHYSHFGSGTTTDWTAQVWELGEGSGSFQRMENNGHRVSSSSELIVKMNHSNHLSGAINEWVNSPSHCSGLMSINFEHLGMAQVGKYWTQNLAEK